MQVAQKRNEKIKELQQKAKSKGQAIKLSASFIRGGRERKITAGQMPGTGKAY